MVWGWWWCVVCEGWLLSGDCFEVSYPALVVACYERWIGCGRVLRGAVVGMLDCDLFGGGDWVGCYGVVMMRSGFGGGGYRVVIMGGLWL